MPNSLSKLLLSGATTLGYNGKNPPFYNGGNINSKLHNSYSINGSPNLPGYPTPSRLDRDGKTPAKYLDNPPK